MIKNQGGNVSAELILVLAVAILGMYGIWKMASNDVASDKEVLSAQKASNQVLLDKIAKLENRIETYYDLHGKLTVANENNWQKIENLEKFAGANKMEIDGIKEGKSEFKKHFQQELFKISNDVEDLPRTVRLLMAKRMKVDVFHKVAPRSIVEQTQLKKTKTGYTKTTRKRVSPSRKKKRSRKKVKKLGHSVASH